MTAQQHPANGGGQTSPTMPSGQILTGKQEHCSTPSPFPHHLDFDENFVNLTRPDLKRELIARQVQGEIAELNSPTALRRFGAPFKSEFGEVAPVDSELPILRYIFVHHVRNFPFLDQAREKEFWQDKLQVVRVSPSSRRLVGQRETNGLEISSWSHSPRRMCRRRKIV